MNILSIDFDYFADCDSAFRAMHFPDGGNEYNSLLNNIVWSGNYASGRLNKEPIESIGVLEKKLDYVCGILQQQMPDKILIADSHTHAYEFVKNNCNDIDGYVDLYNIDYHPDTYNSGDDEVHCGNWLKKLLVEKIVDDAFWIAREDSEAETDKFLIPTKLEEIDGIDFDLIFICRSGWWSPPHLDDIFIEKLLKPMQLLGYPCEYEVLLENSRYDEEFQKNIKQFAEMQQQIMKR